MNILSCILPLLTLTNAYDNRALLSLEQNGRNIVVQVSGSIDLNLAEEKAREARDNIYMVSTVAGANGPASNPQLMNALALGEAIEGNQFINGLAWHSDDVALIESVFFLPERILASDFSGCFGASAPIQFAPLTEDTAPTMGFLYRLPLSSSGSASTVTLYFPLEYTGQELTGGGTIQSKTLLEMGMQVGENDCYIEFLNVRTNKVNRVEVIRTVASTPAPTPEPSPSPTEAPDAANEVAEECKFELMGICVCDIPLANLIFFVWC